jgi:hypothetical protein
MRDFAVFCMIASKIFNYLLVFVKNIDDIYEKITIYAF